MINFVYPCLVGLFQKVQSFELVGECDGGLHKKKWEEVYVYWRMLCERLYLFSRLGNWRGNDYVAGFLFYTRAKLDIRCNIPVYYFNLGGILLYIIEDFVCWTKTKNIPIVLQLRVMSTIFTTIIQPYQNWCWRIFKKPIYMGEKGWLMIYNMNQNIQLPL